MMLVARKHQQVKFEVDFNDDTNQWEADNPTQKEREGLAKVGFAWDRVHQVWATKSDDVALKGMELQ